MNEATRRWRAKRPKGDASRRLKEWERKNPEKAKAYRRRHFDLWKERRLYIVAQLGGKCYICNWTGNGRLDLHHLFYEHPRPRNTQSLWKQTIRDAERNPDQFVLLCSVCHNLITKCQMQEGVLDRIIKVANASEKLVVSNHLVL